MSVLGPNADNLEPALIKDGSDSDFQKDVVEPSMEKPILVDFWSTRCAPCKKLMPILEKHVQQAGGAVRLVKINVEENQQVASMLRIQSVPTVFLFDQGRPVDALTGAVSESDVQAFIARHVGQESPMAQALTLAEEALEEKDAERAANIFEQILLSEPENDAAAGGWLRALVMLKEFDKAEALWNAFSQEMQKKEALQRGKHALDLARQAGVGGDVAQCQGALEKDPDNLQLQYDLAAALFGSDREEEALTVLLEIMKKDRAWADGRAHKQLLTYFEVLGVADPRVVAARKRLSSLLFC